jgi:hypothetical protein
LPSGNILPIIRHQDVEKARQHRSHLESILGVAHRGENCASNSGWAGGKVTPAVFSSAVALLNGLFEHPAELVLCCHMKINEHLDDETG